MPATGSSLRQRLVKLAPWAALGAAGLAGAIQFVPYGLERAPAPAPHPFQWRSPEAEGLARAACYDCHSSETKWWWAVKVAPFSWLARHDIQDAKRHLDFSAWNGRLTAARLQRSLDRGMPPWQYTIAHPEARLTAAQKQVLVRGFQESLAAVAGAPAPSNLILVSSQGPGVDTVITARCGSCHAPGRALGFRTPDPAQARALIERMVRHGAVVPEPVAKKMINYFTRS